MPGLTSTEVAALMPHANKATVASMVFILKKAGYIKESGKKLESRRNGNPMSIPVYSISDNPAPNVVKMKRTAPTEQALHVQIKELNATISELVAWKTNAIARYPDLAVDPVVLKARKLVAEEVRAGGDNHLANEIIAGHKDSTLMVRVAIKALEAGE